MSHTHTHTHQNVKVTWGGEDHPSKGRDEAEEHLQGDLDAVDHANLSRIDPAEAVSQSVGNTNKVDQHTSAHYAQSPKQNRNKTQAKHTARERTTLERAA